MTVLVGIMGPAGAGKSSVADYLVEKYGAKRYSLAAPLKELTMRAFEFTPEQMFGTQAQKEAVDERYGRSPRWFLQRLGTEGIRHVFGQDIWVKLLLEKVRQDKPDLAVVDDCRFVNEAEAILGNPGSVSGTMQGYVWRLESPERETNADANHASEAQWVHAPHSYVIKPIARGLPDLYRLVDQACSYYRLYPKRREVSW